MRPLWWDRRLSGTRFTDCCAQHSGHTINSLMRIRQLVYRKSAYPPIVFHLGFMRTASREQRLLSCSDRRGEVWMVPEAGGTSSVTKFFVSPVLQEVRPLSSYQNAKCSNSKSKPELGASRVKSFLPVPRSKVTQCSQNTKCSSSNTRQTEINNNVKEEIWNLHKNEKVEKPNK